MWFLGPLLSLGSCAFPFVLLINKCVEDDEAFYVKIVERIEVGLFNESCQPCILYSDTSH